MAAQILQGDCLNVMKTLPDKSIDMVFTSPPFKDEDVDGDYYDIYSEWMNEFFRITKNVVCVINSANRLNEIIKRWPPKRTLVWSKGISQYSWRWNPIFIYQLSEDYKVNKYIWSDAFGVQAVSGKWKVHKYQDPVILYETIIKMFKDCGTVLDPFMGSGTTLIACNNLEKGFTGIELNPEYIELTHRRLQGTEVMLPFEVTT